MAWYVRKKTYQAIVLRLYQFIKLYFPVQCIHDRNTDCHDNQFTSCSCQPAQQEWEIEDDIQFKRYDEHVKGEDKCICHHESNMILDVSDKQNRDP